MKLFGSLVFCIGISTFTSVFVSSFAQAQENWSERVNVHGDFRFRQEYIRSENTPPASAAETHRSRIRARLGLEAEVNDSVKAVLQLATAEGGKRNSYSQSLSNGSDKKDIFLDWAYAEWSPSEAWTVTLGKFSSPFKTVGGSQILWDSDLSFEGAALEHKASVGELRLESALAGLWLAERTLSKDGSDKDSGLLGLQIKISKPTERGEWGLLVGNHYITNLKGEKLLDNLGNSTDAFGNYAVDYNLVNVGLFYELEVFARPLKIAADTSHNTHIARNNAAYLVGFEFGALKEEGDWRLGYNWRRTEKDAALAGMNDSDFAGGKTDSQGHTVSFFYALADKTDIGLTYMLAEQSPGGSAKDYQRAHLDLNFKF